MYRALFQIGLCVPNIFRPAANTLARLVLPGLVIGPALILATLILLNWTDYVTGENRFVRQPVPFSHRHHTAEIGIDCRYCHTGVERSYAAGLPPTKTCMTCHSQLYDAQEMLAPIRASWVGGTRLDWNRVHDLADYAYFNHSTHVTNGIACTECHGAVGEMRLIRQVAPLSMGWCLECHRDPAPNLHEPEALFDPFPRDTPPETGEIRALLAHYQIETEDLTDCTTCHR